MSHTFVSKIKLKKITFLAYKIKIKSLIYKLKDYLQHSLILPYIIFTIQVLIA